MSPNPTRPSEVVGTGYVLYGAEIVQTQNVTITDSDRKLEESHK